MNRTDLIKVAESGILAPSADNNHHFRLEIGADALQLRADEEFRHGHEAHRRFLTLISFGAVVENMVLRAGQLGFRTDVAWCLEPGAETVARLGFFDNPGGAPDPLAEAISQRHTNRRMYRGQPLPAPSRAALDGAAGGIDTVHDAVHVTWLEGLPRRRAEKLIWHAETERFRTRALHEELFAAIRFDLDWKTAAAFSLSPASLEVEPPARPVFKAVRRWPTMRALNRLGAHHLFGLRAGYLPARQAPDLAVVSTTLPGDAGAVAAGRAFERLWLQATLMGLSMQPMAASTVLMLQTPEENGASDALRLRLAEGWRGIIGDRTPVIVFRAGHAALPTVRAGRRPGIDYLVDG